MSESASCSTSDFDSEAQLTGRSSLSASPSPPKALKSFKAPARDSPVPRLGLNVPKLAASQAPQASVRRPDKLDMTAALSIDILSSAVQLSGSQRAEQDLPKTRRELSERLGVPAQSLSFYEVRLLDDQGQPSSSGQRLAVHISGSGFSLAALDGLVHEVQALHQQLAESQAECKRAQHQAASLQQQAKHPGAHAHLDQCTSTTGDGLMGANDIDDSPRPASTESTEQSSVSRIPDSFRAPADLARQLSGVRDEVQRVKQEKDMLNPADRFAAKMHASSAQESSRPVSRQPSDIRALLAGPSVDSSLTSLALPDRPQSEAPTAGLAATALQDAVQSKLGNTQGGPSLEQLLQDPGLIKLPALLSWMAGAHLQAASRLSSRPTSAVDSSLQAGSQL